MNNQATNLRRTSEKTRKTAKVAQDPNHSTVEGVHHVSNVDIRRQRKRTKRKAGQCTQVVRVVGSDHSQQSNEPEESNNDAPNVGRPQVGRVRRRRRTAVKRPREEKGNTADACRVCDKPGFLLICDGCDSVYHPRCHRPMVRQIPSGEWYCRQCSPRK